MSNKESISPECGIIHEPMELHETKNIMSTRALPTHPGYWWARLPEIGDRHEAYRRDLPFAISTSGRLWRPLWVAGDPEHLGGLMWEGLMWEGVRRWHLFSEDPDIVWGPETTSPDRGREDAAST